MPTSVFVPAFAKINLTLSVLGRRPDGYHDLASVMQTISLHDTLRITTGSDEEITCDCDAPELRSPENLAPRAAHLLRATMDETMDETMGERGVAIELRKEIPAQGGLGGGSSDAATVLVALNTLWGTGHRVARLEELAAVLGSDVPFFVRGGTCLISGRGEVVAPLPEAEPLWLMLAKPPVRVPTGAVFRALTPTDYGDDGATDAVVRAIRAGAPLPFARLANTLEAGVFHAYPEVAATRDALREAGAPLVRMSGSGPTLYAPFRRLGEAAAVYARARADGMTVWLCRTVPADEVARSRPAV